MLHEQLTKLLAPVVEALQLECWGVEYLPQRNHSVVRVWIDVADRYINLDDCERVSREVSAALGLADPIQSKYTLEVSSPGLERPLFTIEQFARFQGQVVKLQTRIPIAGRRNFKGKIGVIHDQQVEIEQDGQILQVKHDNIAKAHLVLPEEVSSKPKKSTHAKPEKPRGKAKLAKC